MKHLITLLALAAAAPAQDHTGTWQISPTVHWDESGCQEIVFGRILITDNNPSVTVDTIPSFFPPMQGTTNGVALIATRDWQEGSCDFTYTISLTFTSPTSFTGWFDIEVDGPPFFCPCWDDSRTFYFNGFCVSEESKYCTAGTSENGCTASMNTTGTASASAASGFVLTATGAEGAKTGIFFYGTGGRQANPWGNGTSFQCVVPPVMRGGLLTATGTPDQCDGIFSQDLNSRWCPTCTHPLQNPGPGATVQAQLWYRDPGNTSNQTTSLSDAIEFTVCN